MHFQFHNHDLFEKLIGIKSLNIKQCPAGFSQRIISSPPVSLFKGDGSWGSIFQKNRGVNFSLKKREVIMRE